MRKLISSLLMGALMMGFGIGISGCSDESSVKSETQVKGPGGTSTVTDKSTVKTTGENPPPVPTKAP
jgi:hypothetical protein